MEIPLVSDKAHCSEVTKRAMRQISPLRGSMWLAPLCPTWRQCAVLAMESSCAAPGATQSRLIWTYYCLPVVYVGVRRFIVFCILISLSVTFTSLFLQISTFPYPPYISLMFIEYIYLYQIKPVSESWELKGDCMGLCFPSAVFGLAFPPNSINLVKSRLNAIIQETLQSASG